MNDLEAWQRRAIQAKSKLREIASAPNDTIGWREMKQSLALKALEDLEIPEDILIYLRASGDPQYPAELCVRDQDANYNVWGMSPRALINFVRIGVGLLSQEKFFNLDK